MLVHIGLKHLTYVLFLRIVSRPKADKNITGNQYYTSFISIRSILVVPVGIWDLFILLCIHVV
jgi:hypothetical protein